jgi:hypothetical protein
MQPMGSLAQIMRGILFPSSNIIFSVRRQDRVREAAILKARLRRHQLGGLERRHLSRLDSSYAAISIGDVACSAVPAAGTAPVPSTPDWVKFTRDGR